MIEHILAQAKEERSEDHLVEVRNYYRGLNSPEWKELFDEWRELTQEEKEFEKKIPDTMVMAEMEKPRETFLLLRGQYDQPGEKVKAAIPAAFPPLHEETPRNRLGFAKWLVDPRNPLPARVTVNRYWQKYFGHGIVKTAEDFGSQGEWPSHPDLLDWLATEFIESGWDVKHMQRLIVTSATYRQTSRLTPEILERDPENRLYARGPRHRMDAEMVRDNALFISGLLNENIGGPSVKPYQPEGLWEEVAYGAGFTAQVYDPDEGENLYRRSMYTFWKRQCPPPSMAIFDAPNREVCTSRRARTNTPLQALALLNDPQFVEASRSFAERIMKEGGETKKERLAFAFLAAAARSPTPEEEEILLNACEEQMADFQKNREAAEQLIQVGNSDPDDSCDSVELAAWTTVASMILNLDEVITKG